MRTIMPLFDSSHASIFCLFLDLVKSNTMNLLIESPRAKSGRIPESLIRRKFNHLDKFFDRIEFCKVVLRKENSDVQNSFFIEAIMRVPNELLFSSDRAGSYAITLDKVVHDLEAQLRRYKEKMEEKR
jgi:putative sigma-54 modulation protein